MLAGHHYNEIMRSLTYKDKWFILIHSFGGFRPQYVGSTTLRGDSTSRGVWKTETHSQEEREKEGESERDKTMSESSSPTGLVILHL